MSANSSHFARRAALAVCSVRLRAPEATCGRWIRGISKANTAPSLRFPSCERRHSQITSEQRVLLVRGRHDNGRRLTARAAAMAVTERVVAVGPDPRRAGGELDLPPLRRLEVGAARIQALVPWHE